MQVFAIFHELRKQSLKVVAISSEVNFPVIQNCIFKFIIFVAMNQNPYLYKKKIQVKNGASSCISNFFRNCFRRCNIRFILPATARTRAKKKFASISRF